MVIKEIKENHYLVYKIYLFHKDCKDFGYVDAHIGNLVYTEPAISYSSAVGTFETRYNGIKNASTFYDNSSYSLLDVSRGATICTKDLQGNVIGSNSLTITDNDNNWYRSEFSDSSYMALDVHWALQKIYDRLYWAHNKNSYDNLGKSINAYVRASINGYLDNAAWYPGYESLCFGEGGSNFKPLASVDIVAHEFGHGITHYQIGWTSNEGMLNEGLSDIWAAIMEYRISPTNSVWKIGEQVTLLDDCLRDLENPSSWGAHTQMATTYSSALYNTGNDYVKSGVFSHWFYLLVNGGQGINSNGDYFSFDGIGMELAERVIVKAVYSGYLRYQNSFPDVRSAFINTARTFADSDLEYKISNAWYAVGVGDISWKILGETIPCGLTSYVIENVPPTSTVSWQWQNASTIPITIDTTATYRCYIDNTNRKHINNVLVAKIYDGSGSLVKTLTKHINTADGFSATYSQTVLPNQNQISGTLSDGGVILNAGQGTPLTIVSNDFYGASFTFTTTTMPIIGPIIPMSVTSISSIDPSYSLSGNTLQVTFPFNTSGLKSYVKCDNGNKVIVFTIYANSPYGFNGETTPSYSLLLVPEHSVLSISVTSIVDESSTYSKEEEIAEEWDVTIFNTHTNKICYTGKMAKGKMGIDISRWNSGIYVVQVKSGKTVLTKKVKLK